MSIINSRQWKSAISAAKKANDGFKLYRWDDNPADLDGNEATRRVAWLAEQKGYPFMDLHRITMAMFTLLRYQLPFNCSIYAIRGK